MAYSLSFNSEFYQIEGDSELMPEDFRDTDRLPVSVWQALLAMHDNVWEDMCRDVFGCESEYVEIDDVISRIRETDTCSSLDVPVRVWIDAEGDYAVDVYEV